MPTESVPMTGWTNGIDNRSRADRLPEGFVRDLLNLDPGPTLKSRVGYEKVFDTTDCRAVVPYKDALVVADGTSLLKVDAGGGSELLATIAGAGPVAHCEFRGELFMSTANQTLRYDGTTLRMWGVPDVTSQPVPSVTNQLDGRRQFAMTYVNEYGEEGGTVNPGTCPDGTLQFLIPSIPAGHKARIYVSPVNGSTLYLQDELDAPGTSTVYNAVDNTLPLMTVGKGRPTPGSLMASHGGVILVAVDKAVYYTDPMTPHLVEYDRAFFQYQEKITMLLPGLHGVYVSADKCYKVTGVTTDEPRQETASAVPAIPGTGTLLPSGEAVWLSRYGMHRESRDPREGVGRGSASNFYLGEHESGAVGIVEHDGQQKLVATAKRTGGQGGLAAADYFEAEVFRP